MEEDLIRRGKHAVCECQAHLVFVTNYRRGALTEPILAYCEQVMNSVCDDFDCEIIEFNGEEGHVHLVVNFPATMQLNRLANALKGFSARMLSRDHYDHISRYLWHGQLWSRSYYCGTTGEASREAVARFLSN